MARLYILTALNTDLRSAPELLLLHFIILKRKNADLRSARYFTSLLSLAEAEQAVILKAFILDLG